MKQLTKKILVAMMFALAVLSFSSNGWALSFSVGDYKFLFDGYSNFDATGSGQLWGVTRVSNLSFDSDGDGSFDETIYNWGDGNEYLGLVIGGLQYDPTPSTPGEVAYFTGASNYINLYKMASDGFYGAGGDYRNGPGDGSVGSFGTNLSAGNLLLGMRAAEGALYLHEQGTGSGSAVIDDVYRADIEGNENDTLGYLDILGGAWADDFTSGVFFKNADFTGIDRTHRDADKLGYDVRVQGSNIARNPDDYYGWNTEMESSSAFLSAVPEPGTFILLGVGLLSIAGVSRRQRVS